MTVDKCFDMSSRGRAEVEGRISRSRKEHTNNDECKNNKALSACAVPVVDIERGEEDGSLAKSVGKACQEMGIFYVVNHGVKEEVVMRLQQQAEKAFALPLQTKLKAARSRSRSSSSSSSLGEKQLLGGYGGAPLLSHFSDHIICSEGFTFTASASAHHVASNLWSCPWTQSSFREAVEEYKAAMLGVATRVMRAALQWLSTNDVEEEQKEEEMKKKNEDEALTYYAALRLNHYPASWAPQKTLGMPEHTDSAFLTLLQQWPLHVQTLEIKEEEQQQQQQKEEDEKKEKEKWVVVPPMPDALLLHVGDMLQVVSNGRYRSVVHRVASSNESRYSVAYMWGPPLDQIIRCHSVTSTPMYRPLTWKQYLSTRATCFRGALDMYLNYDT